MVTVRLIHLRQLQLTGIYLNQMMKVAIGIVKMIMLNLKHFYSPRKHDCISDILKQTII